MSPGKPTSAATQTVLAVAGGVVLLTFGLVANEWTSELLRPRAGHLANPASRLLLGLLDAGAFAAGLVLLLRRRSAPWRELLLTCAALVFAFGFLEGVLRLWYGVLRPSPQDREIAAHIGWQPIANASFDAEVPGFGRVVYHTVRGGFRRFGDLHTTKPRLLVLGDSFTEAAMVPESETYYDRLAAARPDIEVFAIGGAGFGTLQEFMLLDRWADVIRPDLVLLQMHPNDLINNSHALESRSTIHNNQMTRPYWEHGHVVYRFPENRAFGPIYDLSRHSYLLRLANVNLFLLQSRSADSVEGKLTADDPDVVEATAVTQDLLARMVRRAGVPVVAFSTGEASDFPFWSREAVCAQAGVRFVPGVGEAVQAAQDAGEQVTGLPIDAHWNGQGHSIAARVIGAWLERESLPTKRRKSAAAIGALPDRLP